MPVRNSILKYYQYCSSNANVFLQFKFEFIMEIGNYNKQDIIWNKIYRSGNPSLRATNNSQILK